MNQSYQSGQDHDNNFSFAQNCQQTPVLSPTSPLVIECDVETPAIYNSFNVDDLDDLDESEEEESEVKNTKCDFVRLFLFKTAYLISFSIVIFVFLSLLVPPKLHPFRIVAGYQPVDNSIAEIPTGRTNSFVDFSNNSECDTSYIPTTSTEVDTRCGADMGRGMCNQQSKRCECNFGFFGANCIMNPSFVPLYVNGPDALGIVPTHSHYGGIGATYPPLASGEVNIVEMEVSGMMSAGAVFQLSFYRFPGAEPIVVPASIPIDELSNGPKVIFPIELDLPMGPASDNAYFELKLLSNDPTITNLPTTRTIIPYTVVE